MFVTKWVSQRYYSDRFLHPNVKIRKFKMGFLRDDLSSIKDCVLYPWQVCNSNLNLFEGPRVKVCGKILKN
jgi:hypothetical protein